METFLSSNNSGDNSRLLEAGLDRAKNYTDPETGELLGRFYIEKMGPLTTPEHKYDIVFTLDLMKKFGIKGNSPFRIPIDSLHREKIIKKISLYKNI